MGWRLTCGEGGMEIWDLEDPVQPKLLSVTEVLYFGYETPVGNVGVYDHFAVVECSWGYVHSLDVSDPPNPARDLHVSADGYAHSTGAQRYLRLSLHLGSQ